MRREQRPGLARHMAPTPTGAGRCHHCNDTCVLGHVLVGSEGLCAEVAPGFACMVGARASSRKVVFGQVNGQRAALRESGARGFLDACPVPIEASEHLCARA